ncbi:2'-5' RNA ligase family protein [Microlunatus speluncae]|uniref:2'-5' RNA ligase family protein n=1 Tax=Microlunatus speluncae TaxID=2594267 RepID=UPI0012662E42|nr:2'-5' RNA ligase family protein [Microlunatus speluncae]
MASRRMIAIELFFDPPTDRAVRDVWAALDRAGIGSLATTHSRQHPHLTLAVTDEPPPMIIDRLGAELPALPRIGLDAAGCFPGRGGVVFLAVRATPELLAYHQALHTILDEYEPRQVDQLRPGRFFPHCTVAKGLDEDRIGPAVAVARGLVPISGAATSINAVVVGSGEITSIDRPRPAR